MSIKTLRASGSQLQADVVIGCNRYGSDVAVQVRLERKDPQVEEALRPLLALLVDRAQAHIVDSAVEKRVHELVQERMAEARQGLAATVEARVASLLMEVEREVQKPELTVTSRAQLLRLINQHRSTSAQPAHGETA